MTWINPFLAMFWRLEKHLERFKVHEWKHTVERFIRTVFNSYVHFFYFFLKVHCLKPISDVPLSPDWFRAFSLAVGLCYSFSHHGAYLGGACSGRRRSVSEESSTAGEISSRFPAVRSPPASHRSVRQLSALRGGSTVDSHQRCPRRRPAFSEQPAHPRMSASAYTVQL